MSERLIDSYLEGFVARPTVRNWPEDVRAIVDSYRSYTTISHAVQKDAIRMDGAPETSFLGKSGCVKQKPCPVGSCDNSPAIHRWEWMHHKTTVP
jgi:hypothetical protein